MFTIFQEIWYDGAGKDKFYAKFENNPKIEVKNMYRDDNGDIEFICKECDNVYSVDKYCAHCDRCKECCECSDVGCCSSCNFPYKSLVPGASVVRSENEELCVECFKEEESNLIND